MKNTDKNKNRLWDFLRDHKVATEAEMRLVTCINGYTVETLEAILYARTGYRDLDQFEELHMGPLIITLN